MRAALSPLLAALCLATSVGVPVIDALEPAHGAVLESAHDRAACAHHDNGICTQVAANAGLTTESPRRGVHHALASRAAAAPAPERAPTLDRLLPLGSRAPPRA
jgi:hypothetical protein